MKKFFTPVGIMSATLNATIVLGLVVYGFMSVHQAAAQETMSRIQSDEVNQIIQQLANYEAAEKEYTEQLECLAKNIYFEARSEGLLGQRAVAWVTLNRVKSARYPNTICEVVYQGRKDANGNMLRHQCQFSWYCDGKSDRVGNQDLWGTAVEMAETVLARYGIHPDPTDGAVMYHAEYVRPNWRSSFIRTTQIDTHVFYAEPL